MHIYAISDLHLAFSTPQKNMEDFGSIWHGYADKIKTNWLKKIKNDDLVLIAGDISWAIKLKEALIDLEWIENLPGKKIILKGNHDYWWPSITKLNLSLPPSIKAIQNNAIDIDDISITGTRLWDSIEYNFNEYINYIENPKVKDLEEKIQKDLSDKIFLREIERLKLGLAKLNSNSPRSS